jgi:hypothetical protein
MYKETYKVIVDNREMELYTIGMAAKKLSVSVYTLRLWERKKIIPKAMFRKGNLRLYHPQEVEVIKRVMKKAAKGKAGKLTDWPKLQEFMWPALREVRMEILGQKDEQTQD